MQNAKVTAAQPTGQWEGNYGVMYTFDVTLSDGTTGSVNSKSPQLRFGIGEEVEYEVPAPGKLKLNRPNPQGGGSYSNNTGGARTSYSSNKRDYTKSNALSSACTFLNGTKATKEQIVELADYLAQWLKEEPAPAQAPQQSAPAAPQTPPAEHSPGPLADPWSQQGANNDDLPF